MYALGESMKRIQIKFILVILAVATLWTACSDSDEIFTVDPAVRLEFSTDTVKLDTTFSTVTTPTKTVWVRNRGGKGLRIASIRLESGNQTGFAVNVDGIPLKQENGFQASGLEVRRNDSLQVFVKLTTPRNNFATPQRVKDNLVFTLESGAVQKINLDAWSWDAELIDNLVVKRDTMISSGKPIVIRGGIKVDSAVRLTIASNTTIYFANNAGIDVYGSLRIIGTANGNVVLRGNRLDRMFSYLPYDRVSGQWRGIRFRPSSYDNYIIYADIHSAYDGVVCDSSDMSRMKLEMNYSTIHNCQGYGLRATNCAVSVSNSQITNTLADCVYFLGGDVAMVHCTIAQFYPFDSRRGVALRLCNSNGEVDYPLVRFQGDNLLVTGLANDVIDIKTKDGVAAGYRFFRCILRTPRPETIDYSKMNYVWWEEPTDTVRGGAKNFRNIDGAKQFYDFRLDSVSTAIDSAYFWSGFSETDRLGHTRDNKPDVGCFEYIKN